jgi:hypothetical protein
VNILSEVVEEQGYIKNLPLEDGEDLNSGDIVKLSGKAETDDYYKYLNTVLHFTKNEALLNLFNEGGQNSEVATELAQLDLDELIKGIYGERVGLKVEKEKSKMDYGMALDFDNLWVDPKREFLGEREYTILGRVETTISSKSTWDFIDLLRVASTLLTDDKMDELREEMEIEDMDTEEDEEDDEESLEITDINKEDFSMSGPAIILDPIAVYW